MKLTGILKDKVDKAETMEAKKDIIAEAGMELTDDELDNVAGGYARPTGKAKPGQSRKCSICGKVFIGDAYENHVVLVHHKTPQSLGY